QSWRSVRELAVHSIRTSLFETSHGGRTGEYTIAYQIQYSLCGLLKFSVAPNQVVGRTVMLKLGLCITLEFGNDALGHHLAQLNAPLVEWANTPDGSLG